LFERSRNERLEKKTNLNPCSRQKSSVVVAQTTQARGVSVCRLRRNMAGRAGLFGEAERQRPALLGTAAIAPGEGSAI